MNQPAESKLNNPRHPCHFCAQPIALADTYCSKHCETSHQAHQLLNTHETPPPPRKKRVIFSFDPLPIRAN